MGLCFLFVQNSFAQEAKLSEGDAVKFMQTIVAEANPLLSDMNIDKKQRHEKLIKLIGNNFAFSEIASFVLGAELRNADNAVRAEYIKLFEDYVTLINVSRIEEFLGAKITVGEAKPVGKSDVLVASTVQEAKQNKPVPIDWRIRLVKGSPKIMDVLIGGVSMVQTQRDEFQSILGRDGLNGLMIQIRGKLPSLKQKS